MSSVLVVGATGVLRPAALALDDRGEKVLALARPSSRLTELAASRRGIEAVPADLSDRTELPRILERYLPDGVDLALLYSPAGDAEVGQLLAAVVRRRVVRLVTSSAADPAGGAAPREAADDDRQAVLLLGWTDAATGPISSKRSLGGTRWHTPQEISAAALAVLDGAPAGTLGRVRPWSERPQ